MAALDSTTGPQDCVHHTQVNTAAHAIIPANTKHLYNIYTMLDQRRRRWADVA